MIDLNTALTGEIDQIDYDKQGRIAVLHVREPAGEWYEIRFSYPAPLPDLSPGQERYAILRQSMRPEVSVVRLA